MQDHSPQRHSFGRIAGIAILMSRAAAFAASLTLASCSTGGHIDKAAPAQLSAVPIGVSSEKESRAESLNDSKDKPAGTICAELDSTAWTPETEAAGESGGSVGCGVRGQLVAADSDGDQGAERTDLATLIAWHLRARNLIQ